MIKCCDSQHKIQLSRKPNLHFLVFKFQFGLKLVTLDESNPSQRVVVIKLEKHTLYRYVDIRKFLIIIITKMHLIWVKTSETNNCLSVLFVFDCASDQNFYLIIEIDFSFLHNANIALEHLK